MGVGYTLSRLYCSSSRSGRADAPGLNPHASVPDVPEHTDPAHHRCLPLSGGITPRVPVWGRSPLRRSWKGDEWRGERPILLSDALRLLPATSKCLVELKGDDMSMVPLLQVRCFF